MLKLEKFWKTILDLKSKWFGKKKKEIIGNSGLDVSNKMDKMEELIKNAIIENSIYIDWIEDDEIPPFTGGFMMNGNYFQKVANKRYKIYIDNEIKA